MGAAAGDLSGAASRGGDPPPASSQSDELALSDSAQQLAAAFRVVEQTPWVREDAVRSVRAALAAGRYAIDPRRLAAAIRDEVMRRTRPSSS